MLKRTIVLTNPASLRLKDNQVKIALRAEGVEERSVPIEDIGVVLVENQQVSITIPLLNALADDNVAVIFCNAGAAYYSLQNMGIYKEILTELLLKAEIIFLKNLKGICGNTEIGHRAPFYTLKSLQVLL